MAADQTITEHHLDMLGNILFQGLKAGRAWHLEHPEYRYTALGLGDKPTDFVVPAHNPYSAIALYRRVWQLGFQTGLSQARGELENAIR